MLTPDQFTTSAAILLLLAIILLLAIELPRIMRSLKDN